MWFQIKSYLTFLLRSSNQHGVHSPFVYELVTKCFYKKTEIEKTLKFNSVRKSLLKRNDSIEVNDFGAGSKVFKNSYRKVNKITKIAGISKKKAALLIRLIQYLNPQKILEIGTSVGLGTTAISIGYPKAKITTLEGCKNTANIAKNLFLEFQLNNITIINGDFSETLPELILNDNFELIYFDGNHTKKATLNYFETCLMNVGNNSVFIFDDIHWSKEMEQAWQIIKENPKVSVTIDTFFWGIVFFRKEQQKEDFYIRV